MSNIYVTSDTHFGHANIAGKNSSKWDKGYRNYKSLSDMNEDMIKNINKTVQKDDTLYHLGDWSFGGIDNVWNFRKRINCENIHLILGNHDQHIEQNKILPNVISSEPYGSIFIDGNYQSFGAVTPGDGEYPNYVEAQRLFKSVSHYKEVKIGGKMFVFCHYAFRVWHGSHKGWINVFGHSHDSLEPYGKAFDAGIDSAIYHLDEARPFHIDEIVKLVEKQQIKFADHHDSKTNT